MHLVSRFTGKERDTESGNDYFLARYYSSTFGRFLSPDWSVKVEPVPYAKLGDPQTLNLYAYVGNNPVIHVDLDGHTMDCSGDKAKGIGCQFYQAMQTLQKAGQQMEGMVSQTLNKAGSYVYMTGFKGSGDELKVKVGPIKVEIGHKEGEEDTRHLNGEHEVKKVKSAHVKIEAGPVSAQIEQTATGGQSTPEWKPSITWNGIGGSGGQVGLSANFCHGTCSSIEGGIEGGRMFHDLSKWMNSLPPPDEGSYANK